jgi:hypothetical protein
VIHERIGIFFWKNRIETTTNDMCIPVCPEINGLPDRTPKKRSETCVYIYMYKYEYNYIYVYPYTIWIHTLPEKVLGSKYHMDPHTS